MFSWKLLYFTLGRESNVSQRLLPQQLSQPRAAGTEAAKLDAIMLLPAVAWVSWWWLTEDPASQTVIIALYAIHQALIQHFLHTRQGRRHDCLVIFSLTKQATIWGASHLHLIWEAALKFVFSAASKKAKFSNAWPHFPKAGRIILTSPTPHINVHYRFPFSSKLISCAPLVDKLC